MRSVYVGAGLLGDLAALEDAQAQAERREAAEARRQERAERDAIDAEYMRLCDLVTAVLLASGHHQHKREWRGPRERIYSE